MCEACHDILLGNLVVRSFEESILRISEKQMLRMMCGVQLADGMSTNS